MQNNPENNFILLDNKVCFYIYNKCSHKAKTPKSEDSRTQRMFTQFRVITENVSAREKPQAFENYTTISSGLVTCFRRAMKVFDSS